ncbi:HK97 gp10 family phage protein, partial [Clostridium perfringens]|nr:HK97 gp10 family phage protein [Clostridium perfringens]
NVIFGEVIGRVGNTMEYAPYVHQGTGIYAKDGNGRKTPWKYKVESGKYKGWHITKGQRPQPFLEKAKIDSIG